MTTLSRAALKQWLFEYVLVTIEEKCCPVMQKPWFILPVLALGLLLPFFSVSLYYLVSGSVAFCCFHSWIGFEHFTSQSIKQTNKKWKFLFLTLSEQTRNSKGSPQKKWHKGEEGKPARSKQSVSQMTGTYFALLQVVIPRLGQEQSRGICVLSCIFIIVFCPLRDAGYVWYIL